MPWDVIEQRIAPKSQKPASMRLVIRSDGGLPALIVSLRKTFCAALAWKSGDRVGLSIGQGEHEGLIRISRLKKDDKNEVAKVRRFEKGGMSFDFGHVPKLGDEAQHKTAADAQALDADTIQVRIPVWSEAPAEEEDDDDAGEPPAPPARVPPAKTLSRANGTPLTLKRHGVEIDLSVGEESISFKKKTMDLTTRQAAVLAVLLRASPSYVGRKFILENALTDVPQHMREASLDLIAADLSKTTDGLGLTFKNTKGVGMALIVEVG